MSFAVVFGGLGFIGRRVVSHLFARGQDVIVVDDRSVEPTDPIDDRATLIDGTVSSEDTYRRLFQACGGSQPDIVWWLAAQQGYTASWSAFVETNVLGPTMFIDAAQKVGFRPFRVCLASSQAVYAPGLSVRESDVCAPPSVYGLTKLFKERLLQNWCSASGMSFWAFRYSIVLGKGQSLQSTESGVFRNWVRDERPIVYGNGLQIRDFVHVDDVAAINALACDLPCDYAGTYNVSGPSCEILTLARIFATRTGKGDPEVTMRDVRPGGEYSLTSCSSLARARLGWTPTRSMGEMIEDFLDGTSALTSRVK